MAMYGKMEEYTGEGEEWSQYVERIEFYFTANSIENTAENAGRRKAILLSVIGGKTYGLLRDLLAPDRPSDKTYDEVVEVLKKHFQPKPSEIVMRYKFNTRTRKSNETVADYVADLRHLSEHCNYGASLENMLRDRIVCGINDESTQRKLLSESNLTFQTAFDTAQGMETAQKHVSDLRNDSETDKKEPSVLYTAKKDWALYNNQPRFKSQRNEGDCYRCGGSHSAESCPHKNTRCHHCSKVGHLIRCCRNKSDSKPVHNKSSNRQFGQHKSRQTTHHMTATGSDSDTSETYSMFKVGKDRDQMKPYQVDLSVNSEKLSMEIDTGASVSVISESAYKAMEKPPQLKKSNTQLYTYTGNQLEICGAMDVSVEYHGKINILPLVVVAGDGPNLLGRNWLSVIQLDWSQIFNVCQQNDKPLVQVLDKYSDRRVATITPKSPSLHIIFPRCIFPFFFNTEVRFSLKNN